MDLRNEAERWLAADPDPDTRAELTALLAAGDHDVLAERFGARLAFGTAGIRGPLGAGPARMNRAVVRRVTAGLAAHLLAQVPDVGERGVVVGRDARHKSDEFAADTAGVLAAAGIPVRCFAHPVPTPLLAFAVRHLETAAGVQVTASHNPGADNGYKVYWSGGAQIIPPLDDEISAAIDAVTGPVEVAGPGSALISNVDPGVVDGYVAAALGSAVAGDAPGARDLRIAYTSMHGVGNDLALRLLREAGFADVHSVPEQAEPDPDFSTVPFPNPEEPGALDLALGLAAEVGADLVLANDPDADRIAVAVPADGRWRALSGDEVGCVLAESLLTAGSGPDRLVGTTVVSSALLGRIAEHHGVGFVTTLTGFKWLAAAAADAEAEGRRMVLAYEQALGVMVGTAVRDKDGLSAAVAVADLAARLKGDGRTLVDALDDLAWRHGLHVTRGRSLRLSGADGPQVVRRVLDGLRRDPPRELAGVAVAWIADHATGLRTSADDTTEPAGTPPADLFAIGLADGARLQVRPSGTEPLLKFYFEVVEPVRAGPSRGGRLVSEARARAQARLDRLSGTLLGSVGLR